MDTNSVLFLTHIEARITIEDFPRGIVWKGREYLDLVAQALQPSCEIGEARLRSPHLRWVILCVD